MDIGCTSLGGRMTNKDAFRCSGRLGGCLPRGGVYLGGGGVCPGGCLPAPPPVNRMTDKTGVK